jgi:2-methylaconitate cis-trans-isomerase PrpF
MKNALPNDPQKRDAVIRAIYGSPDLRQIDGLGGADVLTSKLAIISPASRPDADVDYTFGQVSFETDLIDYQGNCGNISSAVGPFAIDEGLVAPMEPVTTVRIHLTNSSHILIAEVPVKDGKAVVCGDYAIDGCPGTGAKITLDWSNITGPTTGKLLPTGKAKDVISLDGKDYTISLVDVGNPLVFIHASSLDMKGTENPAAIEADKKLMSLIEKIRGVAAVWCGLVEKPEDATLKSPYIPFFAIVSEPADYATIRGLMVQAGDIDLASRLLFMLKMHKTYPITGTACTGAAVRIPGTVAWDVLREEAKTRMTVRIGHPGGVIPVETEAVNNNGEIMMKRIGVYRTARRIMDGYVYVRKSVY